MSFTLIEAHESERAFTGWERHNSAAVTETFRA
jgi:hypothetical protein